MYYFLKILNKSYLLLLISIVFFTSAGFAGDSLFVSETFTPLNSFSDGVEGPAVDGDGNIYAVNYQTRSTIGKITPQGECSLFLQLPDGSVGNGIRFSSKGDMFIADYTNHNILKVNMDTKKIEIFAHDDRMNQPNDIAITDNDIIYASDPNWSESTGNLWMIDTSGTTHLLASGMGTTNGIEVSPDNKTLYVNESTAHRILAFDILENDSVSNKRVLKQFDNSILDGMRCDSTGNLYVACYNKGVIYIVSPDGDLLRTVNLIGTKATNIAFGGEDGKTCYITVADNKNLETFRTDTPGRSWVMRNIPTAIKRRHSNNEIRNFRLGQNYPNPFNPKTKIYFEIPVASRIELSVYTTLGQNVSQLINNYLNAGSYCVDFDASELASGVYIYTITDGISMKSKRMILIK